MKRKLLQSIGDSILRGFEKTETNEMVEFYYELGMWFDMFCINYFDIYLE